MRDKKEKIMARMKIKKVSPESRDQLVLGFWYLWTIVIQFSPGTEWTVHLIEKFETSLSLGWL